MVSTGLFVLSEEAGASLGSATTLSTTFGGNIVAWRADCSYALIGRSGSTLVKYDETSGFMQLPITVPGTIYDIEWRPSNDYALIVGGSGTGTTVYKFDGTTLTAASGYVEYGGYYNYGVSWKSDGSAALIVNDWGSILQYDPGSNSVSKLGDVNWGLYDVEWSPTNAYALCVGLGVYKYDGSITTIEPYGAGYGAYFGVSFRSDGSKAMLVTNGNHVRLYSGGSISEVGTTVSCPYKVHYAPSSTNAIITIDNGHLCECDESSVYDLPTEAYWLRGMDWRSDGEYAMASGGTYTIKYVPGIALSGQVIFDKWGYLSGEVASIAVTALSGGLPVSGVSVSMSDVGGGIFDPTAGVTDGSGVFKTNYTVPIVSSNATETVTASLSKAGYSQGTAQNMTLLFPCIFIQYSITPTTFYLGENATLEGHASLLGFPDIPVVGAQVQVNGGTGKWDPAISYTDSNGDFGATYGTHQYVGGDEWHSVQVSKLY